MVKIKDLPKIDRPTCPPKLNERRRREKLIAKRLRKFCACCGRKIKVILYRDKTYRGGHYFCDIPIKSGKLAEYWECPKCYWGIKK